MNNKVNKQINIEFIDKSLKQIKNAYTAGIIFKRSVKHHILQRII